MNRPPKLLRSVLLAVCDLADSKGLSTNQITNYVKSRAKKTKLVMTARVLSSEIQKALKFGTKHYLITARQRKFRKNSGVIKPVKDCSECRRQKRQKSNAKKRRTRRQRRKTRDSEEESNATFDDSTEVGLPVEDNNRRGRPLRSIKNKSGRRISRRQSSSSKNKEESNDRIPGNRTRDRSRAESKSRSRSRSLSKQKLENIDLDQDVKESTAPENATDESAQPDINFSTSGDSQPNTDCGNADCLLCPCPSSENFAKDDNDHKII